MDDKQHKYILLQVRVGERTENEILPRTIKSVPTQFLRGQMFVALPETEQPEDNSQICLTEIEGKGRLLCPTTNVAKLVEDAANLLFAITSAEERYRIFRETNRLDLSLKINVHSKVLVKVKGAREEVPGIVWYKGELPTHNGTMFGVELVGKEFQGLGTSNGMFRNKEYFICQDDCGVFVAVDKIRLQEGQNVHSPKKDSGSSGNKSKSGFKSYLPELPSVFSMSKKDKHPRPVYPLRIDQRVVTFVGEKVARGSVRYIADKPDDEGWIAVGIELDRKVSKGSGYFRNRQRFDCKKDFALFVRADEVIPEQDFDFQPQKQESKLSKDTNLSASLGYYDVSESKQRPRVEEQLGNIGRELEAEKAAKVALQEEFDSFKESARTQEREFERRLLEERAERTRVEEQLGNMEKELEAEKAVNVALQEEFKSFKDCARTREREVERHLLEERLAERIRVEEQLGNMGRELEAEKTVKVALQEEFDSFKDSARTQEREFERRLLEERAERTRVEEQLGNMERENEVEKAAKVAVEEEFNSFQDSARTQERESQRQKEILEWRIRELEASPRDGHVDESPEHARSAPSDWIIARDEIHVTEKRLGVGGWGEVLEGKFRGCDVAVKQIHELILSPHNRRLFEREMTIASRCRHPCLLQFIGATNDNGTPLFVMELLDTNLRSVLESRALMETEIVTIALDVAKALNYLHLHKPLPIIHRDISSANVLLWRRDDRWRAKVSDYGAANFMRQCKTINPGAVIYSAPEAFSAQQTSKIDVFSFGLLLCEMCIRELPVPEHTQQQVAMVTNHGLRNLITRCVHRQPEERPSMEDIINDLETLQ